jgi:transcriptional regulator with XRE-family HTH domain
MTFGEYIRDLRKQKGLRQRDVARIAGINATYLSKMEHNATTYPPKTNTLLKIGRALKAEPKEIEHLFNLAGKDDPLSSLMKDLKDSPPIVGELVFLLVGKSYPAVVLQQVKNLLEDKILAEKEK